MRLVIGSISSTVANVARQVDTSNTARVVSAKFRANAANFATVAVGTSSALTLSNGWSFISLDPTVLEITRVVRADAFWIVTGDTASYVDYVFEYEN